MPVTVARYHNRERITLNCTVLTPMFLGGAEQEAALSAAPFKAALRYWWRVGGVHAATNPEELFQKESKLFGAADDQFGKSLVEVAVEGQPQPTQASFTYTKTVGKFNVPALLYLANLGLLKRNQDKKTLGVLRRYFPVEEEFKVHFTVVPVAMPQTSVALNLFQQFGGMGGRSRNAWGSLDIKTKTSLKKKTQQTNWLELMKLDFPTGLGMDKKLLCWRMPHNDTWESAMYSLAKMYINLRSSQAMKAKVGQSQFKGKHLLGSPVKGGTEKRSASALRFTIRLKDNGYVPIILHIPYMNPVIPVDPEQQIQVWQKVHSFLDDPANGLPRYNPNEEAE